MTIDPNLWASLARQYTGGINAPVAGQAGYVAIVNDDSNNLEYVSRTALLGGVHSVLAFGADPTGATDSTAAIQAAIDAASAAGGGIVHLPAGTYLVHLDPADYSEAPSDRRVTALVVRSSGVRIVGDGIGITTIRCTSADGAYGVLEFAQLPIENGVVRLWDCAVRNITLDGNRDSAEEPTHRASVLNFKGTARLDVEHVQVIRSAYYGIGFQNGGFQKCRVHHVLIENVGADGIDIKDSGAISEAFEISDLWISNFGRLTDPFAFAGLDVASLAPRIRGIHITGFGGEGSPGAGLRLKQGTNLAARGWGPQWAVVSDVIVEQTNPTAAGVQGVRINSGLVALSNVHVNGVTGNGIRVEQSHVRASNVLVYGESSATGIYLRARSLAADEQPFEGADDCVFSGVTIIGCDRGIHNSRKRNRFSAVKLHDCATGVYGDSAIEAMAIDGIDFSGTVTTPWVIGGTRHQITGVYGAFGPYDGIITTASEPRTRMHYSYSGFRWLTGYTGDPATADEFLRLQPSSNRVSFDLQGGNRDFVLAASGTGKVGFSTGGTERGAFISTGFVTGLAASVAPASNGQMMFELTNDTTLTVRVKGSDGVTRAVALTLA